MFVTVMTAFGTAALFWSDTVPSICPFKACDWVKAGGVGAAIIKPMTMDERKRLKTDRFMSRSRMKLRTERKRPKTGAQASSLAMSAKREPYRGVATGTVALQSFA